MRITCVWNFTTQQKATANDDTITEHIAHHIITLHVRTAENVRNNENSVLFSSAFIWLLSIERWEALLQIDLRNVAAKFLCACPFIASTR